MDPCGTVTGRAEASLPLGINLVALLEGPAGDELPFAVVAGVATLAHGYTGEDPVALVLGRSESAGLRFDLDVGDNPTFAELVGRARACLGPAGEPAIGDDAAPGRRLELRHRDHRPGFEPATTGSERELRVRLDDVRHWPRREVRLSCVADGDDSEAMARVLWHLLDLLERAAADPERRAGDLVPLDPAEGAPAGTWNATRRPCPSAARIHELGIGR